MLGREEVEASQPSLYLFSGSEFNVVFKSSYQGDEMMHVFKGKYISSGHFS